MTDKQKRFCEEYLVDLNATQAAIRAGYKVKTARSQGQRLLTNVDIQRYLSELMQKRSERTGIDADTVLEELRRVALTDAKITGSEKLKALELLGKHIGIFDNRMETETAKEYAGIPSKLVAPAFARVVFDVADHAHTEYVLPGGRGSAKSSFVSLEVIDLLMRNETMHALVLRQVSNTIKDSVFAQLQWAISALGLDDEFYSTKSPMEITRKRTGQKIFFRGADDSDKVKSIKPPFGYIGVLWFEELDQFLGAEAVRKIEQSAIRGGDIAYIFKSFNPPKSAQNWANKYIAAPSEHRLTVMSNYLTVPKKWLGAPFLEQG